MRHASSHSRHALHSISACSSPTHSRARKTSRGCGDLVPWSVAGLESLEGEAGVFALETGGEPLDGFTFPPKGGTVLVGSEELGLSPEALARADAGAGRVTIPMSGTKRSLNVAVSFGILLWAWRSHRLSDEDHPPPRGE